jgi:hypothetical protein
MAGSETNQFSAFHGRPLSAADKDDLGLISKLADLGVFDVEQFVGLGAIGGTTTLLATHLGMSEAELSVKLTQYKAQIPDDLNAVLARPTDDGYFSTGAFLTASPIKYSIKKQPKLDPSKVPSSLSHIGSMFPIQDQGVRGTCVAFGATALHEFYARKSSKPRLQQKLSEQFLYEEIKRIDGSSGCGTWLSVAIQVLNGLGQCPDNIWAYNPNPPCNNNGTEPKNARGFARSFPARGEMLGPKDVNGIRGALFDQSVVALSFPVFISWQYSAAVRLSGRITLPLSNETSVDGHCMCAVGYQDDPTYPGGGYFIVRNSWGALWASESPYGGGYGTIPYQYIAQYGSEAAKMKQRGGGPVSASRNRGAKTSQSKAGKRSRR